MAWMKTATIGLLPDAAMRTCRPGRGILMQLGARAATTCEWDGRLLTLSCLEGHKNIHLPNTLEDRSLQNKLHVS